MECGSGSGTSSGWSAASGRLDVAEASGWTLKGVNVLGELFCNLDTCQYLGATKF